MNAWAFYDWANSVYPLVITSTVFPEYYNSVTSSSSTDMVRFLGFEFVNTALYSYTLSFAFLLMVFLSPLLSGIADYGGKKKGFMRFFAYTGAFSCTMLYFFEGSNLLWGLSFFALAAIGFSGSLVFYNAFLPGIATREHHDRLSARGYAMGYMGSVLLLLFNLWMIMNPGFFGFSTGSDLPTRFAFLTVGLWWFSFSLLTFHFLPVNIYHRKPGRHMIVQGFKELWKVWQQLKNLKHLRIYLLAFFTYSIGVQTIMYLAPTFGAKEIGLPGAKLIISILIIQIVAIAGATFFAFLSGKIGNIRTLMIMIVVWTGICAGAYYSYSEYSFYALAFFVGIVMGGIQSLSRSTYSRFLPDTHDHASFFSFYDISEKLAIVIGTATYGLIEDITGSMRNSVFSLMIFFLLGFGFLIWLLRQPASQTLTRVKSSS